MQILVSSADSSQRLRRQVIEFPQDCWYERHQVFHAIADRLDHKDCNRQGSQVLLEFKVPIHRQKDIELRRRERQQFPVLDSSPPALRNREAFMPVQQCSQPAGKVFVKQDAHLLG